MMQKLIILSSITVVFGTHLREYGIKLENWNTGRVYVAEKNDDIFGKFGPVCTG